MTRGDFYDRLLYLRECVGNYEFEYYHSLENPFLIEIDSWKRPNDLDSLIEEMEYFGSAFMLSEQMYLMVEPLKWDLITDIDLNDDRYYYLETL